MSHNPGATMLLLLFRVSHVEPEATFAIDEVQTSELLRWSRDKLRGAIASPIAQKRLRRIHKGTGRWSPHLYQLRRR